MRIPNPGSIEALEQGCLCPPSANSHGKGMSIHGKVTFILDDRCPVHKKEQLKGEGRKKTIAKIVKIYEQKNLPLREIANETGVSHTTVDTILREQGCRISPMVAVNCYYCGKDKTVYRSEARRRRRMFCNKKCWEDFQLFGRPLKQQDGRR